jgi:hypothetical protein
MAIRLSGTPQQQKAPFSAFDTSSNFQSGLVDVGRAIKSVGAGQRRVEEKAKREAEEAEREAQAAKVELERKTKASQNLLAKETELVFAEQVNAIKVDLTEAIKFGDFPRIQAAQKKLDALDPNSSGYNVNNFLPKNHRSELTDESVIREAYITNRKLWSDVNTSLKVERINAENYTRANSVIDGNTATSIEYLDKYRKEGASNEVLLSTINSLVINNPRYASARESTSLGTARTNFEASNKQLIVDLIMNQFEHESFLSADDLDSRMETISGILKDPALREAGIIFDPSEEEAITKAYTDKRAQATDKGYQKEQLKLGLDLVDSQLGLAMDAETITAEDLYGIQKKLATLSQLDRSAFSTSQLAKFNSMSQLVDMFVPDIEAINTARAGLSSAVDARERDYFQSMLDAAVNDDPLAYQILQYMTKLPEAKKTTVATALKDFFGSNFTELQLGDTEQGMLSDWVTKNLSVLRNVGENPRSIGLLSPAHAELVKKAMQGDKNAYHQAAKIYSEFVKNSPDLANVAPPNFYVTQQETPTTSLGNEDTFVNAVMTNVVLNGSSNTLSHATHVLNQGDVKPLEVLRYRSEQLAAEILHSSGGNQEAAEQAVSTLVEKYKFGLEADDVTDNLFTSIQAVNAELDTDEVGEQLTLLMLTDVYALSTDPSRKAFYETVMKGFIETNKTELLKTDSPKKQHKIIRDKLFEETNVFPYVAALGNGGVVELPTELNNYIDPAKDRAGFFTRFVDPVIRVLSDGKESVENVGTVYTTAALLEMFDQNPSLNINQILKDIGESVSPSVIEGIARIRTSYSGLSGSEATALPLDSKDERAKLRRRDALRTRRALIRGLTELTVDEKPLLKISTELMPNEAGFLEKVAVMNVLTRGGKYEPLARSATDRRPITAPLSKVIPIVENTIPRITSFMQGVGDDTGNVDAELKANYLLQLFGIERANIARLTHKVHEQTYNKELMAEDREAPIWRY